MTINSLVRTVGPIIGDGIATSFPFAFKVFAASEVSLVKTVGGIDSPMVLNTDYSVVLNPDQNAAPGGTITYRVGGIVTNIPVNTTINGTSNVQNLQPVNLTNNGGFFPTVINAALDRLTILVQQLVTGINSALKYPVSDGTGISSILPNKAARLGKVQAYDGVTGAPIMSNLTLAEIESGSTDASASALLAQAWATLVTGLVAATDYAAKAYAIGGVGVSGVIGAAKEWAISPTSPDGTTSLSARSYSLLTAADRVQTGADVVSANAAAAAAAASAAEGLYNNVETITFADSPFTPSAAQEGYLFRIDTSGGAVVINLSTLATYGEDMKFGFVKATGDGNGWTVNRGGSDTINDGTSVTSSIAFETHAIVGDSATGTWIDIVQTTGIPDGAVTEPKIATSAVTASKIAAGAVLKSKLDSAALYDDVIATTAGTYVMLVADDLINIDASGAAKTVTPLAAATYPGKVVKLRKADSTFNVITITGVTTLNTQGETVTIESDGTNWLVVDRYIPSVFVTFAPAVTTTSGAITNFTAAASIWRRVGDSIHIRHFGIFSGASAVFNQMFLSIPTGLTIDPAKIASFPVLGNAGCFDIAPGTAYALLALYQSNTTVQIAVILTSGTYTAGGALSNTAPITWAANDTLNTDIIVPITGWNG